MHGEETVNGVEEQVARELAPDPAFVARLKAVRESLQRDAEARAAALGVPLRRALVAGSAARETYLPGQFDIDLFVLFDPSSPRTQLVEWGMALGNALLEHPEKRFAEHPYLRGQYQGFTTEVVPGYAVERSDRPQTAVDRTPFHLEYLQSRHTDRTRSDARLLKKFLKSLGVYGAEVKTGGFSGYLVELLTIESGGFRAVLERAAKWRIPERLSPPGPEPSFEDGAALILSDPVDVHRNVAAALSRQKLGTFILAAQAYLAQPRREFFFPPPALPWGVAEAKESLAERGTTAVAVLFPVPDLVPDILFPQLRKTERSLASRLTEEGFGVIGTASSAEGGQGAILVEVQQAEIGPVGIHDGPMVGIPDTQRFLGKWRSKDVLQGPYVTAEGRLQAESRERARGVLERTKDALPGLAAGRDLREPLARHARVVLLVDALAEPAVLPAAESLCNKRLPWAGWAPLPP